MDTITIDLETHYSKDYSLSKMQTDAYVLDPRFETILVTVITPDNQEHWFSGDELETIGWLHQFPWDKCAVRCHNTLFDGFILTQRFGIRPKLWKDTLGQLRMLYPYLPSHSLASMAKLFGLEDKGTEVQAALGKRRADFSREELLAYASYGMKDTRICKAAGERMDHFTPPLALKLIDMTIRMFTEPMLVGDKAAMQSLYEDEVVRKQRLLEAAEVDREIIMSNNKFAARLEELGVVPPKKISKTTGKETFAFSKTDKEFTDLQEHDLPEVQALVAARLGTKTTIAETRAARFIEMASRGPLPVALSFWGAKTTGRYSGTNMVNWQNLPARGPSAGLRNTLMAPPGYVVLVGDSSNIELRTVMALAGQDDVVDKLKNKVDLYCDFASRLFGRQITKADKSERQLGKVACIAEGSLVLTDSGLVPIEQVTTLHRVWDGVEWVRHDGVVYKGERDVIEYQGLRATPDHRVCLEDGTWCEFGNAANQAARIAVTGDGRHAVQFLGGYQCGVAGGQAALPMPVRDRSVGGVRQLDIWEVDAVQRVRDRREARARWGAVSAGERAGGGVGESGGRGEVEVLQPKRSTVGALRRARDRVQVSVREVVRGVRAHASKRVRAFRDRQDRQQWALRSREPAICVAARERQQPAQYMHGAGSERRDAAICLAEPIFVQRDLSLCDVGDDRRTDRSDGLGCSPQPPEELARHPGQAARVRVYDIVNAGPRSRFTVSNVLVHNCLSLQYGAGAARFQEMVRVASQTDKSLQPITLDRAHEIVDLYRSVHWKVVELWRRCDKVILPDIAAGCSLMHVDVNGWFITQNDGFGRPGEPGVMYHDLKHDGNEWTYQMGRGRVGIHGAKVVENLSQHAAMQIVMWQTARINERFPVKLSVHDEAVCVVREEELDEARAYMEECLSMAPKWCRGVIPVACETGIGPSYGMAK